jgi:tRNA (guanine26-N2/guanine27-N2)-dimethyltransferase
MGREDLGDVLRGALWRLEKEDTRGSGEGELTGESGGGKGKDGAVDGEKDERGDGEKREMKVSELKVVFDESLGREPARGKLVRYQINPRENWGPMNRAGGS